MDNANDYNRATRAIQRVLRLEGGYVDDPYDSGGETKYGICKRSYPHINIKDMTMDRAIEIYYSDWWRKYRICDIVSDPIAFRLLDQCVVSGPIHAIGVLQRAVNKLLNANVLMCDGVLGPHSISTINSIVENKDHEDGLVKLHMQLAIAYYKSLNNHRFIDGWINRVNTPIEEGTDNEDK